MLFLYYLVDCSALVRDEIYMDIIMRETKSGLNNSNCYLSRNEVMDCQISNSVHDQESIPLDDIIVTILLVRTLI